MDDAHVSVPFEDDELGDGMLTHEGQCFYGGLVVFDGFGVWCHEMLGCEGIELRGGKFFEHAAQVTVGDDAQGMSLFVFDHGTAQTAGRHFQDNLRQG